MNESQLGSVVNPRWFEPPPQLPEIQDEDSFQDLIRKLSFYFVEAVQSAHNYEELRTNPHGRNLPPLITYLSENVHHRAIVSALLALKGHFAALESDDDRGINEARGYACEVVAWRFVTQLSSREAIDYLLYELPPTSRDPDEPRDAELGIADRRTEEGTARATTNEQSPLLPESDRRTKRSTPSRSSSHFGTDRIIDGEPDDEDGQDYSSSFQSLNALEIAAVSGAKKFLSQRVIQRMIERIWRGDVIFWETLSVNTVKQAKIYNKRKADPYCRLRVPRYLKAFEVIFFLTFLALYYIVLVQRDFYTIKPAEIFLYIYIAGFAYDEFGEFRDAGQVFYITDFWSLWDIGIVAIGAAFLIARITGLVKNSDQIIDTSFDILALEALFLVPRICSLLSLNSYFGTLIPCLKEMTKDFIKFLSLVVILYLGFLTTFTLLARGYFTPREMAWILIKVFFGSSYLGFDVAQEISPYLGPPVMLVFVCMTNILLITSLISLLSNSLTRVLDHAREEYLFVYSVYVLEASTSNRLTYYLPPLNLIALLFRPVRLFVSSEQSRTARIVLLKVTHLPYVAAIWAYEYGSQYLAARRQDRSLWASSMGGPPSSSPLKRTGLKSALNTPRPLSAATWGQASLNGNTETGRGAVNGSDSRRINGASSELTEDLKSLVIRLSSQVEELTAIVAGQQLQGQQSGEDEQ